PIKATRKRSFAPAALAAAIDNVAAPAIPSAVCCKKSRRLDSDMESLLRREVDGEGKQAPVWAAADHSATHSNWPQAVARAAPLSPADPRPASSDVSRRPATHTAR